MLSYFIKHFLYSYYIKLFTNFNQSEEERCLMKLSKLVALFPFPLLNKKVLIKCQKIYPCIKEGMARKIVLLVNLRCLSKSIGNHEPDYLKFCK